MINKTITDQHRLELQKKIW